MPVPTDIPHGVALAPALVHGHPDRGTRTTTDRVSLLVTHETA
jgi:hypothetical protein